MLRIYKFKIEMKYKEVIYDKYKSGYLCYYFFLVKILCKLLFLVFIVLFRYLGMNFSTRVCIHTGQKFLVTKLIVRR